MQNRRSFLNTVGGAAAMAAIPLPSLAQTPLTRLKMPPLLDASKTGQFRLDAQPGQTNFLGRTPTETWGFNQAYLGPTLKLATGATTRAEVRNGLNEKISVHWHGLLIPGNVDGGPHQTISSGATWAPELSLTQPSATTWYHSHVHGQTAQHVMFGLAGVLQIDDGRDDERGLPFDYGIDDLTLVLQDRRFDRRGRIDYGLSMPDQMTGFTGDTMVINGQVGATAVVPAGLVRLRLLNGSNARIYTLALSDSRPMQLIGTDNGLLDRPVSLSSLQIAPGERYEILVDFSDRRGVSLVSASNPNVGMMGGGRSTSARFEVLPFAVDGTLPARISTTPDDLGGSRPHYDPNSASLRSFTLDMGMGPMMMMRRSSNRFSINGATFDMNEINFSVSQGELERWVVSANMMMHPFHVHGVSFQVLSENDGPPQQQHTGWKDTVLINGQAELLVRFEHPAPAETPFMYHCHILEHEDGGMMGQFVVT